MSDTELHDSFPNGPTRPAFQGPPNPRGLPLQGTTDPTPALLRLVDANVNRAAEGLRVVEDLLRFHWEDPLLTERCKDLRHDLSAILAASTVARIRCRSTTTDLGTSIHTDHEMTRGNLRDVALANSRRAAEALRVLAELMKLWEPTSVGLLEQLRYRLYTLEKGVLHLFSARERLAAKRLYLLMDLQRADWPLRVSELCHLGVGLVQLRDKQVDDRTLIAGARELRRILARTDTLLVINDRPDIACSVRADGVHLGQTEMSVADARAVVGPDMLIGVSTHSLVQAEQAVLDGADYLGVGPMFPSTTKSFQQWEGPTLATQVRDRIGLPWFAIGGIGLDNIDLLVQAGVKRVALQAGLWGAQDPSHVVRTLELRLGGEPPATTESEVL